MFSFLFAFTAWVGLANGLTVSEETATAVVHPDSISHLEIMISDGQVKLAWQIQTRTIMEVTSLEWDGADLWSTTNEEAQRYWAQTKTYLEGGFDLQIDGEVWLPEFEDFELREEGNGFYVECIKSVDKKPRSFHLGVQHFFEDGNGLHIMDVYVSGLTKAVDRYFIQYGHRTVDFPLPRDPDAPAAANQSTLQRYFTLGWGHVLEGVDHLAFVLALLFGVATWRALLAAVTAFTLAHSITLALSAFNILQLSPSIVEPGIAISVAVVLWWHLWKGPGESHAWKPAFGFGLLHGCGFAGVLGEIGIPEDAMVSALLGFNLGVEAGQLTFVVPVIVIGLILHRVLPAKTAQSALHLFAIVLAAFAFHLVGLASTSYIGIDFPFLPDALQALPVILVFAFSLWLIAGKRPTANGQAMRPQVANAFILALLYETGFWLGS
ncbi:MAG: HupE/UreJ family protein [Planctomycetes bacterium]|nr:HupE/UreJ family protein [Planctomycetota bacterium]